MGALLRAAPTAASDPAKTTSLDWVRLAGAEACIGAGALAAAVERRLGRPALASAATARRSIEGHVEPTEDRLGFRATFALADASGTVLGTRELQSTSADCRAMDVDLALVAALMIDPDAALASASPAPSPAAAPPPPPPAALPLVVVRTVHVPVPAPPPAAPWRLTLRAGPMLSLGLLPSLAVGAAVRATVAPPRLFPWELGAVVWGPQRAANPVGAGGVELGLSYGSLAGCPLAGGAAAGFRYAACLGLEVGAAHAGGFGFAAVRSRDIAFAAAALSAHARRRLVGPLFASAGLGMSIPFVQLRLVYIDAGGKEREAFTSSAVFATLDAALGIELP